MDKVKVSSDEKTCVARLKVHEGQDPTASSFEGISFVIGNTTGLNVVYSQAAVDCKVGCTHVPVVTDNSNCGIVG